MTRLQKFSLGFGLWMLVMILGKVHRVYEATTGMDKQPDLFMILMVVIGVFLGAGLMVSCFFKKR